MSNEVRNQEPKALWNHFADLNAVPRASKKEEEVIAFAKAFGEALNLPTVVDHIGNVIIKKPATVGMENRKTIVLQSHLDMVHQKNNDTVFDFATEGIKMYIDGDWIKADGTTLGADNGIGVASIMALLASTDIPHPPMEALFTIDEETGMTGALELKGGFLDADIMLNLDTEDDDELTIGCAGGIDITANGSYQETTTPVNYSSFSLTIKGLSGGHSGMEIHKGLGNANKLMNRILTEISNDISISIHSIDGGGLRNAIPRESLASISVSTKDVAKLEELISETGSALIDEHTSTDMNLEVVLAPIDKIETCIDPSFQSKFLKAVYACPSGIYRMSPDIADLVQTSNNLARVLIKDGKYQVLCLTRSSVDTEKMDLAQAIRSTFELVDASVSYGGDYPGWTPKPNAGIVHIMKALYREMFNEDAHVYACHAGLECGILGTNYPEMEMISFGPNIRGAHSPDERVQISSVQKYWGFLLETLKRIPVKD
ncbi:MAG: dipeptidase D [Saprospiraceae bacterium]|jgi:dipeptidase D|tara:strand:- start:699 stop:2162 length:1464 start_codon:yes stop_codon:yes gene_type:complete